MSPEPASLLTGVLSLVLAFIAGIQAVGAVIRRLVYRKHGGYIALYDIYQDEDGAATEESSRAFSDRIPRIVIVVSSAVGLLASLGLASLTTAKGYRSLLTQNWIQFALWVLIGFQTLSLFTERQSTKRFSLGIRIAFSGLLAVAIAGVHLALFLPNEQYEFDALQITLYCVQLGSGLLCMTASTLLPRRPDVIRNGKIVDRQYTTSWLGRTTFAWTSPLLAYAVKNRTLSIADLPELDYSMRSRTLKESFDKVKKQSMTLWKALIYRYSSRLALQLFLTCVSSILSFTPQICLLQILRVLELRSDGLWNPVRAWMWVLLLGIAIFIYSLVETWLFWTVYSKLGIPIYEQLAATVFAKSMQRKDVKGLQKSAEEGGNSSESGADISPENKIGNDNEDEDDDARKSRQATINLVAIDAKRVSDFATFNYFIPATIIKLTVACIFLIRLIGWKSLCAGLGISIVVTPLNIFLARRYTNAQTDLMKYRDQKMAIITEVLQGIRQIKFSALEKQWESRIAAIRNTELDAQWSAFLYDIGLITIWIMGPVMLSAVSLGVYNLIYGQLSASVAFTTMSIFASMELSLAILPEMIADLVDAWVSVTRIDKYLNSAEKVPNTIPAEKISFKNATIAWPAEEQEEADERFTLQNLTLSFPAKGLSVISGKTGSGKSLLLASILGESDVLDGEVRVPVAPSLEERFDELANKENWIIDSAIAFVAQVPWIENASIRDNIVFGLPFDQVRYAKVLSACALEKDLEMFPDGELTDIGANGVNLSGGQKWRISFARALYSRAGILVMDDLFSALDAHTGRHLHVHALNGELGQGRTRILVTHHVALCLDKTEYSIHLQDGIVQHAGSVEDLRRTGSLTDILANEDQGNEEQEAVEHELDSSPDDANVLQKVLSNRSARSNTQPNGNEAPKGTKVPKKFQQEESRETGSIKLVNYKRYFQSGGSPWYWLLVAFTFFCYVAFSIGRSYWVNIWTRSSAASTHEEHLSIVAHVVKKIHHQEQQQSSSNLWFYLGIYFGLSVVTCIVGSLRYALILMASIQASRNLFRRLTYAVLRAPLRWLDTIPVGRILNRFSSDFNMIDSRLSYDFGFMMYNVLQVLGIIVAGWLVSPYLIIFAVALLVICLYYARRYLAGAREIKRLESNAKSPIYEQFGSALIGLGTIRAYGKADTYVNLMYTKIDRHCQAYWHIWLCTRWFSFRMNTVSSIFATITAALVVSLDGIDAPLAGFALSFALEYTDSITWMLRQYTNVELDMNATERVLEYSAIEIENQEGSDAPAAWPTEGRLEVSDLVVSYAPDLPPVLKGLSFNVEKNQRVGVVGRTGAGKSSLTLALFRFLEAREGTIYVDGIDISKIKLHDLRSRLAIIPQDPVLFSGTIRSNLDPFDEFSDAELRDALERVHLVSSSTDDDARPQASSTVSTPPQTATGTRSATPTVTSTSSTAATDPTTTATTTSQLPPAANTNIFNNLNSAISEGGLNLSQGQRQLLCLARAIVSRPKIMVLDEATSAVDMSTDALIQRSIRSEFGRNSTTLLVIAHRISTIADFDRILVMDAGKAVEFGHPKDLMKIEGGAFRGLVEESGEREELERVILGE